MAMGSANRRFLATSARLFSTTVLRIISKTYLLSFFGYNSSNPLYTLWENKHLHIWSNME